MVLIGRRAVVAALLVAAVGCKQSLFDARTGEPAGGPDGGASDGAVADSSGAADAIFPAGCPEPCLGDAVSEFDEAEQEYGFWRYEEDLRGPLGLDYRNMAKGEWSGVPAWVGDGSDPPPAIVNCSAHAAQPACAGAAGTVLVVPVSGELATTFPALTYVSPVQLSMRVSGRWVTPGGGSPAPQDLFVFRNGRLDTVFQAQILSTASPQAYDFETDVLEGDRLRFVLAPRATGGAPVGLSLFVTGLVPNTCQLGATFAGGMLANLCGAGGFTASGTQDADPPPGLPGRARRFGGGEHLELDRSLDYSGDFTVQFWAKFDGPTAFVDYLFDDIECSNKGGLSVTRGTSNLRVSFFHNQMDGNLCVGSAQGGTVAAPSSDAWHFYRVTRSTAAGKVSFCLDGVNRGQWPVPGDADMSSLTPPNLGRSAAGGLDGFRGSIADVRVLSRELPCRTGT